MERRILQLGDPILRARSEEVRAGRDAALTLEDLRDTLHAFQRGHGFGRGISAVQIGVRERVIYIEFEGQPYCLQNPEWQSQSDEHFSLWDDCFSFPDLLVRVHRSSTVTLRYLDENGCEKSLAARDAFSELLQHEMDHLDGILAVDRAIDRNSFMTRNEWLRQREVHGESRATVGAL